MEVIEACGLTVMIDSVPVRQGQCWETVIPPGVWFGTVLAGELAVRAGDGGAKDWGPGASTRFRASRPLSTCHHALRDGVVTGVFVRVPPDHMEAVLGGEALRLLDRRPAEMGRVSRTGARAGLADARLHPERPGPALLSGGQGAGDDGRDLPGCRRWPRTSRAPARGRRGTSSASTPPAPFSSRSFPPRPR